jgi:ParB family chromosome partitioning protein
MQFFKQNTRAQRTSVLWLAPECIQSAPMQPRTEFSEPELEELAQSVKEFGILNPLTVRRRGTEYELIAGERRLRAAKRAGLREIPCLAMDVDLEQASLIALVENLQREQLHYLDVALACRSILERYPISQERLAASLSLSPSTLANRLRLLRLPTGVQSNLRRHGLSERHARALLRLSSEADQLALVEQAAQKHMSVAQLERQVDACLSKPAQPEKKVSAALRDSRMIVNALLDTVRQLTRIGVPVQSKVEEGEGCVRVIVTIPAAKTNAPTA